MDVNVKERPNLIMSCFVLHNFCELRNEKLPNGYLQNPSVEGKILQPDWQRMKYRNLNESSAKEIRKCTLNKLYNVINNHRYPQPTYLSKLLDL